MCISFTSHLGGEKSNCTVTVSNFKKVHINYIFILANNENIILCKTFQKKNLLKHINPFQN